MIPYIVVFTLTLLLTYYAEKYFKNNEIKKAVFLVSIAIFIMSFLAAIRDDNVGKDIITYVIPSFKWAQGMNFFEFMNTGNLEFGYMIFVYIITKLFNNYHFILFFLQMIVCVILFIYAYKQKDKMSMVWIVLTYLLLFYNDTFTMMRQSVAYSFILLSLIFLKQKKYFKTGIFYLLAISFHTTAFIAILLYALMILNYTDRISEKKKKKINITLVCLFFIGIFIYQPILYVFTNIIPILPNKFYAYLNSVYYLNEINISKSILLFKSIMITIVIYMKKVLKDKEMDLALILLLIDMSIYIMSFKLTPIMRLGFYFTYPVLINIIPRIPQVVKKNNWNKIYINIFVIIFLFTFWYFTNIIKYESGGTYPYTSKIFENIFIKNNEM